MSRAPPMRETPVGSLQKALLERTFAPPPTRGASSVAAPTVPRAPVSNPTSVQYPTPPRRRSEDPFQPALPLRPTSSLPPLDHLVYDHHLTTDPELRDSLSFVRDAYAKVTQVVERLYYTAASLSDQAFEEELATINDQIHNEVLNSTDARLSQAPPDYGQIDPQPFLDVSACLKKCCEKLRQPRPSDQVISQVHGYLDELQSLTSSVDRLSHTPSWAFNKDRFITSLTREYEGMADSGRGRILPTVEEDDGPGEEGHRPGEEEYHPGEEGGRGERRGPESNAPGPSRNPAQGTSFAESSEPAYTDSGGAPMDELTDELTDENDQWERGGGDDEEVDSMYGDGGQPAHDLTPQATSWVRARPVAEIRRQLADTYPIEVGGVVVGWNWQGKVGTRVCVEYKIGNFATGRVEPGRFHAFEQTSDTNIAVNSRALVQFRDPDTARMTEPEYTANDVVALGLVYWHVEEDYTNDPTAVLIPGPAGTIYPLTYIEVIWQDGPTLEPRWKLSRLLRMSGSEVATLLFDQARLQEQAYQTAKARQRRLPMVQLPNINPYSEARRPSRSPRRTRLAVEDAEDEEDAGYQDETAVLDDEAAFDDDGEAVYEETLFPDEDPHQNTAPVNFRSGSMSRQQALNGRRTQQGYYPTTTPDPLNPSVISAATRGKRPESRNRTPTHPWPTPPQSRAGSLAPQRLFTPGRAPHRFDAPGPSARGPLPGPSQASNQAPGRAPDRAPSQAPGLAPGRTSSRAPSRAPSLAPGRAPSRAPSLAPGRAPSQAPSLGPGRASSRAPSLAPGQAPSRAPSLAPGQAPSRAPSLAPGRAPSRAHSLAPGQAPSRAPGQAPSRAPSLAPGQAPSRAPSQAPAQGSSRGMGNTQPRSQPSSLRPTGALHSERSVSFSRDQVRRSDRASNPPVYYGRDNGGK